MTSWPHRRAQPLTAVIREDNFPTTPMRTLPIGGRSLFVIDNHFDLSFIRMMSHYVRHMPFWLLAYDTDETDHLRHWGASIELSRLSTAPLLRELASRVVALSTELYSPRMLRLDVMHCNAHLYGDEQNPHTDQTPGVTAVYFANDRWETDWAGETIFYDEHDEPLYAVIPRPGRLVMFDAAIVHRGGVPSRLCVEPRLSVAFKFAASLI